MKRLPLFFNIIWASTAVAAVHPLDPLSKEEIDDAVAILRTDSDI